MAVFSMCVSAFNARACTTAGGACGSGAVLLAAVDVAAIDAKAPLTPLM
jgi:hypothetical protein